MKCKRSIGLHISALMLTHRAIVYQKFSGGILWYEFVTNVEVATLSQLPSINEAISRRKHSFFGHVRRMDPAAPAHQAHTSQSRQGSEQLEETTRPSMKMLGGAGHHEHGTPSF